MSQNISPFGALQQDKQAQNMESQNGNQPGGDESEEDDSLFNGIYDDEDADSFQFDDDALGLGGDDDEGDDEGDQPNQNQNQNRNQRSQSSNQPQDDEKNLIAEVNEMVNNLTFDVSKLPADFDSTNPDHLGRAFTMAQQQAATATLQMVIKPVQHMMTKMQSALINEVSTMLKRQGRTQQVEAPFENEILPMLGGDKKAIAFMKATYAKALKANRGDAKRAISATKQIGKSLGYGGGGTRGNPQGGGSETRQGAAALDSFFGSVTPPRR